MYRADEQRGSSLAPQLSIVTTVFRSATFLDEFYVRITEAARKLGVSYELLFVNDGSPDDSAKVLSAIAAKDPRVFVIHLSRNFGHHEAAFEGLLRARGETVYIIDCDLEEQPEWLTDFWAAIKADPSKDLVYGVGADRTGSAFNRLSGRLFYKLFNLVSDFTIPANVMTTRIMTRRYIEALSGFSERMVVMAGIYEMVGFRSSALVKQKSSKRGSSYSFLRRYRLMINAIVSFSSVPLELVFYSGLAITTLSVLISLGLLYGWLVTDLIVPGWVSIVMSIWLVGGIVISFLGIISIYLSVVFKEVKARPRTIVKVVENYGVTDGQ
jgi:putative glycosyltransferase